MIDNVTRWRLFDINIYFLFFTGCWSELLWVKIYNRTPPGQERCGNAAYLQPRLTAYRSSLMAKGVSRQCTTETPVFVRTVHTELEHGFHALTFVNLQTIGHWFIAYLASVLVHSMSFFPEIKKQCCKYYVHRKKVYSHIKRSKNNSVRYTVFCC